MTFDPGTLCFSAIGMDSAEDVTQDIVSALSAQGLIVEQYMPELGPGQQELSIHHAPASPRCRFAALANVRTVTARPAGRSGECFPEAFGEQAPRKAVNTRTP